MSQRSTSMAARGKRKTKLSPTLTQLPEDIIREEILTLLPIKSVVRFKCVSKSWLSLFSDSKFVKEYRTRNATQNPNDYDCLVVNKRRAGIFILSRYTETCAVPFNDCEVIGSIHGLICIHAYGVLSLWNPAIRQSKEFTLPPRSYDDLNNIGLGFDPVSNDYKVVVCYMSRASRHAMVYSSNSDSWTDVFVPDFVFSRNGSHRHPVTIVRNCPYWNCTSYSSKKKMSAKSLSLVTIKFDVGSNEFKLLPEFYINGSGENEIYFEVFKRYQFMNMKDCLTLVAHPCYSDSTLMDVFSLDDEECGVWSKVYCLKPFHLDIHGDYSLSQGFKYGDEIVFHNGRLFYLYDVKTETIKQLPSTTTIFHITSCFTYTPSLVFIRGMKSVYSPSQTRTPRFHSKIPHRLVRSLGD